MSNIVGDPQQAREMRVAPAGAIYAIRQVLVAPVDAAFYSIAWCVPASDDRTCCVLRTLSMHGIGVSRSVLGGFSLCSAITSGDNIPIFAVHVADKSGVYQPYTFTHCSTAS